ncbi:hypothetical protein ABDK96_03925 [Citricoccus nitrophenolicus]|uniref:Septum formation-related domain-containing protein n=1 Tax=Citricoccus nitrophenolicus TaxID=863575 RepID=A0ABV0IF96_9MICC
MTRTPIRLLAGAALASSALVLSACANDTSDPQDTGPRTASQDASPSSSSTATPSSPTPTPTPTPASLLEQIEFSCSVDDEGGRLTFTTLEEAWEYSGAIDMCEASYGNGYVPYAIPKSDLSVLEWKAVQTSYPDDPDPDNAATLYGICATNTGYGLDDELLTASQAQEIAGVAVICPDHPHIDQIQSNGAAAEDLRKEEESLESDRESGRFVEPGNYLVGDEIPPGTWRVQGEKVTDCYWEISDANGEIIANNFVSTSAPFNVKIPSHASGFTVEGCSFRWISE